MIKLINKLMALVSILATLLLAASVVIVTMQIVWRYVLSQPLGWTDQMARFSFMWFTMLGIPVMFNKNIMMSFDLVINAIHGKAHNIMQIVIRILGIAFCVCYAVFSIELCIKTGPRLFPGVKIPYNSLYSSQIVCAVLLGLVFFKQILEIVVNGRKKEDC